MILIDTSGLFALVDDDDPNHHIATAAFEVLLADGEELLIHTYVLVESAALMQRRLGLEAALTLLRRKDDDFRVHWITPGEHDDAVELLARRGSRRLSLVDCASFVVMRQYGVTQALSFDADFEAEGFTLYRASGG